MKIDEDEDKDGDEEQSCEFNQIRKAIKLSTPIKE